MKETIRLFKAVPITAKRTKKADKALLAKTLERGFVFAPEVVYNYTPAQLTKLVGTVEEELGLTAEQMNSTFHKSWAKVRDASMEQLVMEQIIHYFTTYGYESLGIYRKELVFIPAETLEIPELTEGGVNIVVIKGLTKVEIKERLLQLLQTGIAMKEDTINDVLAVIDFVGISKEEVETVKNKEVKIALYDKLKIIPENPTEFLRYCVYKATGNTLLIKDRATIATIKETETENFGVLQLFVKYKKQYGLERLGEIFHRFKPLFLAFKTHPQLNSFINRIKKLADIYHKPMPEDFLNEVTAKIGRGEKVTKKELEENLAKANTFRKIRLAYALKFRTNAVDSSILYKIRNGKAYATQFSFEDANSAQNALKVVLASIIKDIGKNVKGKTILIPETINYTLPATEKQFTGDFPSGSYVTVPKDMVFGVHWSNVPGYRVDLDLSLINADGKIGWDSAYRDFDKTILFSGDITDAPGKKGATELFYVKRQAEGRNILMVNYFNYDASHPVPFKILVAQEQVKNLESNYTVDPNNIVTIAKTKIDKQQNILGLLVTTTKECRFYFSEASLGMSISSSANEFVEQAKDYLFNYYTNTIGLKDVLVKAGAKVITKITRKDQKVDIDLSPETLEKGTIIDLIR